MSASKHSLFSPFFGIIVVRIFFVGAQKKKRTLRRFRVKRRRHYTDNEIKAISFAMRKPCVVSSLDATDIFRSFCRSNRMWLSLRLRRTHRHHIHPPSHRFVVRSTFSVSKRRSSECQAHEIIFEIKIVAVDDYVVDACEHVRMSAIASQATTHRHIGMMSTTLPLLLSMVSSSAVTMAKSRKLLSSPFINFSLDEGSSDAPCHFLAANFRHCSR